MADTEIKTKVCSSCERELPLTAFNRNPASADGRQSVCNECMKAKSKRNSWKGQNLAFDRIPWPFNE